MTKNDVLQKLTTLKKLLVQADTLLDDSLLTITNEYCSWEGPNSLSWLHKDLTDWDHELEVTIKYVQDDDELD